MGKKEKNRLPEKQSALVKDFHAKNQKQQQLVNLIEDKEVILATGVAGTGKTYVLNQFVRHARAQGKTVAMTATTGLAATHLNGTTIHSWAGIGVHDVLPKDHVLKMGKQRKDIIQKTDVVKNYNLKRQTRMGMPFINVKFQITNDKFQIKSLPRR